jgi:hypothetical protein
MRARALAIVATLVLGSAISVSAAPSAPVHSQASGPSRSALGFHRDDFRSAAALRAARVRVLAQHAQAAPRSDLATAQQPVWGYGNTESALPDIDGDGVGDVLSARFYARTPSLKVLSGKTGRTLWSVPAPQQAVAAIYVPEPGGKSVMVLLSEVYTGQESPAGGAGADVFTVHAVNPRTGASVWSTSIQGAIEDDPAGMLVAGVGEFDGVLLRNNTTPYLLLDRFSLHFDGLTFATSVAPLVIDATNGNVVHAGEPMGGDDFTIATPIGDLDGDGTDDYLVCAGGDVGTVGARSGATGAPLWTTETTTYSFLVALAASPDLSGDRKADLLLTWYDGGNLPVVHAVNGATGADVWTAAGDYGLPLGDIDRDGRSDSRVVVRGPRMTFTAIGGTGKKLWSRDVLTPSNTNGVVWGAGDIDGDHYGDVYIEFVPHTSTPTKAETISGRTGKSHALADLGWPLAVPLRGAAPSFVRGVAVKKGFALTAYDGRSHLALWRSVVKGSDAQEVSTLDIVGLGHGRVALLVLLTGRFTNTVVMFDGRRGTRMWSSVYETPGDDGGIIFD